MSEDPNPFEIVGPMIIMFFIALVVVLILHRCGAIQ